MARIKRPNQSTGWMAGFVPPTATDAALALGARLRNREGIPTLFPDAIARLPFVELDQWSD